jgi:hypothetical protein
MPTQGKPGAGQKRHWEQTYSDNPSIFGEGPSEFAAAAVDRFRREGVRTVLEPGCGHGLALYSVRNTDDKHYRTGIRKPFTSPDRLFAFP